MKKRVPYIHIYIIVFKRPEVCVNMLISHHDTRKRSEEPMEHAVIVVILSTTLWFCGHTMLCVMGRGTGAFIFLVAAIRAITQCVR